MEIEVISNAEDLGMDKLPGRISNTSAKYVVVLYAKEIENFSQLMSSIAYWWRLAYKVSTKGPSLLIFERKARGIANVETYSAMKNYYWSERLEVGSHMMHELETIRFIKDACPDVKLVVELGGFHGGLTLQLSDNFPEAEIHSFDICLFDGMKEVLSSTHKERLNIVFHREDILCGKNVTLLGLLRGEGKKLLYCDNGKKIVEVRRYAPCLSEGDILGVHDWGVEISEDKVKKTLDSFTPMFHDELAELGLLTRLWKRK